jgi:5-(carboxyamino)imidazole ribonucleotide synthase
VSVIAPGSTIGFLGGGQLGRMAAMAARTLGYQVHVLDPDAHCPAAAVADRVVAAAFNDADAAEELARQCDVVTLEIEQIGIESLHRASRHAPVRPGASVLGVIQDRAAQKRWLATNGFPVGDYAEIVSAEDLDRAVASLGGVFLKSCRGGYDGRSQIRVPDAASCAAAWESLAPGGPCVAERALDLHAEISVMVARRPSGQIVVYPAALNHHENQVLAWSVIPASLDASLLERAAGIARGIAAAFSLEGLLAVEMFVLRDGTLLVNELAPRPHNSYHETEVACATSQFEQLVRAVCDLPLGEPTVLRPGAIVNLFGDLWIDGAMPPFDRALAEPGVRLHLYGKRAARAGRKMGHLSATGATPDEALSRVRRAREALA